MNYDRRADRLIGLVAAAAIVVAVIAGVAWSLTGDDSADSASALDAPEGPVADASCALDVSDVVLAVRDEAAGRLAASGATVTALPPAADLGDGEAGLPVENAAMINCPLTTGRLSLRGGLRFDVAGRATEITDLVLDFDSQTAAVATSSPGFDGTVSDVIDSAAIEVREGDDEVVYVIPVNLLSNEAGTLDDALQKAAMSEGGLPSDSTLTIVASANEAG